MSHHSKYVVAACQPFHPNAVGAKLPTGSPAATFATGGRLKLDGILGADGSAVIMFNPSPWSNVCSLWYSNDSAATGHNLFENVVYIDQFASSGGVANFLLGSGLDAASFSSLPFEIQSAFGTGTADLAGGNWSPPVVRARVVSSAVSITFTGTTLNDGGVYYQLVEPTHDNMMDQSVGTYLSQFTSTKFQKISLRDKIEWTVGPVTRAQQELSNAYDDVFTDSPIPLGNADVGPTYTGSAMNDYGCTFLLIPDAIQTPSMASANALQTMNIQWRDPTAEGRALASLYWPCSRRNAFVAPIKETAVGGASLVARTCSVAATGIVTWTANAPFNEIGRIYAAAINPDNSAAGFPQNLWFMYNGTNWMAYNRDGTLVESVIASANYNFIGWLVMPPVVSGVIIQAGSAMAGQTFHIEACIHCEYSGKGVQGRTSLQIPHQDSVDAVTSAVAHAREKSAAHEHSDRSHDLMHAFLDVAGSHMPEIASTAIACIAPEAAPVIGPVIRGLTSSLGKRRF